MKIAILGKGGSGKSSISWLLTQYLSTNTTNNVLAIDADHNMDLSSCLGYQIDASTKLFYKSNKHFKNLLSIPESEKWQVQFSDESKTKESIKFGYKPADEFLIEYINPINSNLDLLVVGLGEEDIMYTGMCSHGLSSPLKYLLPRLEISEDSYVVLDSVAGSDMVNYGLYFGFDVVSVVVEGHINSIKVAKQLDILLKKQGIELHFILNKYNSENQLIKDFIADENYANRIIGRVPIDTEIMNYDYSKVSDETRESVLKTVENMKKLPRSSSQAYELLKAFETKKTETPVKTS